MKKLIQSSNAFLPSFKVTKMDEEKSKQMTGFLTDFLEYLRACEGSGLPTIKVRRKKEENVFITSFCTDAFFSALRIS